jgi:hypothetical protein
MIMHNDTGKDKIVLVVGYQLMSGDEQDVDAIVTSLVELIETDDAWFADDDHDDEAAYSFTVTHTEVVDADVVETSIVDTDVV